MKNNKFYEFKNVAENEFALYVYGEIVSEKQTDWFTGQKSDNEVDIKDFKEALAGIPNGAKLNMYVNSVGGSVFATSSMVSMLQRAKDRGIEIDAYIDGLACSCASWLIMSANKINIYKNSVMMIHKPMSVAFGNANDFKKEIEVLDKIEDGVIIPMYEDKAKVDKDKIKELMNAETWLTADEIQEYFNVDFIDEAREIKNIKSDLFNTYKNTPKEFKQEEQPVEDIAETSSQQEETSSQEEEIKEEEQPKVDYSAFENTLNELKGGKQ